VAEKIIKLVEQVAKLSKELEVLRRWNDTLLDINRKLIDLTCDVEGISTIIDLLMKNCPNEEYLKKLAEHLDKAADKASEVWVALGNPFYWDDNLPNEECFFLYERIRGIFSYLKDLMWKLRDEIKRKIMG